MDLLPATVYQSPTRQARGTYLKTIVEEAEELASLGRSDSEGDASDSTVRGRPTGRDAKVFVNIPSRSRLITTSFANPPSPVSSVEESPCSSTAPSESFSVSQASSAGDGITVFSDDCPSLASDPTTFASDSNRSSFVSTRSSRNHYPPLLIPRGSWSGHEGIVKEVQYGMSPATKIQLSHTALSALPRDIPAINAPPSLGDGSSIASESPCVTGRSCPTTPDMRNLEVMEGQSWGTNAEHPRLDRPLEIALDEDHSIILSPADAHSATYSSVLSPGTFGNMFVRFPRVPGGTPEAVSPIMPAIPRFQTDVRLGSADNGVYLPPDALQVLDCLTRPRVSDEQSECSTLSRTGEEMRERPEASPQNRPHSADGVTPLSEYSFTALSIPSPGGFFSSLQEGTRNTWCLSQSKINNASIPSSAVAEVFYKQPWKETERMISTILSPTFSMSTEGPPTARAATFNVDPTPNKRSSGSVEDKDLYGAGDEQITESKKPGIRHEYEEAYEEEIKQAAEANIDRTGSWLSAQTSYLSALRESNPVNDPLDFPSTPNPLMAENECDLRRSMFASMRKTVSFLETASKASKKEASTESANSSPMSDRGEKEPIYLEAFLNLLHNRKRRDAFLYATSRMEAVRSLRTALPSQHIASLRGQYNMENRQRPKYSGPFSQNPRGTGIYERNAEQAAFHVLEREQMAMSSVVSSAWQVEALRAIYQGRLLASSMACDRLTTKSTIPLTDPACIGGKRLRILDFGGTATASWGWEAARQWPNAKVYTVITKEQARSQRPSGGTEPAGPVNHRTVSVPHLWQLPFRGGHFDVISARSLFTLLKSNPVPGVPEIDEFDLTLRECMRVLKPGGYLDFMVMDSSITQPGPLGQALNVEFGFELQRRGYDREVARTWLRRLKTEGFVGTKRTWVALPMGKKDDRVSLDEVRYTEGYNTMQSGSKSFVQAPRPLSEVSTISKIVRQYMDVEAVQGPVGSTQAVADTAGLLGTRIWEQWLVKLRAESGRDESRLLEGVDAVLEEGKENGSGWKVLVGWARKPRGPGNHKRRTEIHVAIEDQDLSLSPADPDKETGVIPMMIQG